MKYFDKNTWFWIFLAGIFFLPFLGGVHLFDWDEINFAELAREMLINGNWLQMEINYETFTEKPPLFFWLQATAMSVFGVGEYAARFPNALLGMIVLPFLYISGKFLVDRKFGFLWALTWFGSILPFLYFKSGIIDPFFNFFIFNGLFFLIHFFWKKRKVSFVYLSKPALYYLMLGGAFIGLGVLTKGPVAYLLVFLTLAVYLIQHRFKTELNWGHFFIYSFTALGVFLLWFGIDALMHGPDFLIEFTIRQWELLTRQDAGHGGFPGYHFVVLLLGCFPVSIFALRAFGPLEGLKPQLADFKKWMVILFLVVLILFSLVGTKIIHYSSMAYYPLSFLGALSLWHRLEFSARKTPKWEGAILWFVAAFVLLVSIALPYAGMHIEELKPLFEKDPFATENLQADIPWSYWDYLPALWFTVVMLLFTLYRKRSPEFAYRSLFFGNALWVFLALIFFVGKVERISQRASVEFFESYQDKEVYVTTFGYKSYVPWFYARIMPYDNPMVYSREWLLHGETDRDVIISTKVHKVEEFKSQVPDAELLYNKNGFYFFRRPAQAK